MDRKISVDLFRFIAIIGVIAIHSAPFSLPSYAEQNNYKYAYVLINQMARFAVPFFFIISGFFWGVKIRKEQSVSDIAMPTIKKITFLFVIWSLIYLFPFNFYGMSIQAIYLSLYENIMMAFNHPLNILLHGTSGHLWFLSGLVFCLIVSSLFAYFKCFKLLIFISLLLYTIGVVIRVYYASIEGLSESISIPNIPFFTLIFFVSGYCLSGIKATYTWAVYGVVLAILGAAVHFYEVYWLWSVYDVNPGAHSFVFGTYFFGLGIALIALSNHPLLQVKLLGKLGGFTLGIYVIHMIFIDLLKPLDHYFNGVWWELSYTFVIYLLSLLSILYLNRFTWGKKILMGS